MKLRSNQGYQEEASRLLVEYERFSFDAAHHHVLPYFPSKPATILDIGSGTGRDAGHLADLGHKVTAVEPTDALREGAQKLHPNPHIQWVDDGLPDLKKMTAQASAFDLILASAVWMHLDQAERKQAMSVVASLLRDEGMLIVNTRHGPVPGDRQMFEVSDQEMFESAMENKLCLKHHVRSESILQRNRDHGVTWSHFVFSKSA